MKVGPLRARGWRSAPDAIVTAPRFRTLAQLVWSGSIDDSDFGYDPVLPASKPCAPNKTPNFQSASAEHGFLKWATHVIRFGEDTGAVSGEALILTQMSCGICRIFLDIATIVLPR